ncbi:hypothetical protein Tco_1131389 [Tanacetum coccineum]
MQDHLEELPVERFEAMEQDIEGLHGRIKATQHDVETLSCDLRLQRVERTRGSEMTIEITLGNKTRDKRLLGFLLLERVKRKGTAIRLATQPKTIRTLPRLLLQHTRDLHRHALNMVLRDIIRMTTLAEHIIVAGAEKRPPMLEKSMYDSWASHIRLFIKGKKHGRMMLDSINNGPVVYPTVEENRQTRPKKYSKLTEAQQLQDDCNAAKNIWDRVKMLMKGTELSYQEHECKLYNLFDKFDHVLGETLYEYYWRFSQLINNMHTIRMTMQQVQVNTKFRNALPSEWSKFVTDVKLAKSLYTTNYDQLYAYLSQHE